MKLSSKFASLKSLQEASQSQYTGKIGSNHDAADRKQRDKDAVTTLLKNMGFTTQTGNIDIDDFHVRPDGTLMRKKSSAGTADFGSSLNVFAENILEDLRNLVYQNAKVDNLMERVNSRSPSPSTRVTNMQQVRATTTMARQRTTVAPDGSKVTEKEMKVEQAQ